MKTQTTTQGQPTKKLTITKSTIRVLTPAQSSPAEPTQSCTFPC